MLRLKDFILISLAIGLGACGSGSNEPGTGTLTIGLTDAPVQELDELTISFVGATVKPENGEPISWTFETPRDIDLMALQNGLTANLISNEPVPAGRLNWIAIDVNPDPNAHTAVMKINGQTMSVEINVPSNRIRFVSGVTITENQDLNFMIDWDLLRAVTFAVGRDVVQVRPAWRVVDMTEAAAIGGMVAQGLVEDGRDGAGCAPFDPNDLSDNVVYLYNLMPHDAVFDDIFISDSLEEGPIGTTQVVWNADMSRYEYNFVAVSPGDYTLAFTCQDDPPDEQNDDLQFRSFVDVLDLMDGEDVLDANFE
jgi:hypothetical protein